MDSQVEVPAENRTPLEHLEALAKAAGTAAGIRVFGSNAYVNAYFGVNQYLAPMGGYRPEDRQYLAFDWGAKGTTAREALVSLLSRSCSTLTWRANCKHNALREGENGCFWNVIAVMTGEPPHALQCDRCTGMRMLPTTTPRY